MSRPTAGDTASEAVATPTKPRARNPKENVARILARSSDAKTALQAGLAEMRTRLGIAAPEEEATFGSEEAIELAAKVASDELFAAMEAVANRHDKTPEESQADLKNLVVKQKTFLVTTQVAKIARIQSVIDACEGMKKESDLTAFPAHIAALDEKLVKFEAMPSSEKLAKFEAAVSTAEKNLTAAQGVIDKISEFDQKLSSSPKQQRASLIGHKKATDVATDQFLDASITAATDLVPPASLDRLKPRGITHDAVAESVQEFNKEAQARHSEKIAKTSTSSATRIHEITAKLEELSKPKGILKRFFAKVNSFFGKSKPDEVIKAELTTELSSIADKDGAWTKEQLDNKSSANRLVKTFTDSDEPEPAIIDHKEIDLNGVKKAVDDLNSNTEIRKALRSKMTADEREKSQKAEFLKSAKDTIQYNRDMAKAHAEGVALPPADNAIKALSAVHAALSAIPLPGMAMVSAALTGAAKAVHSAAKKNRARRVANFASEDAGLQDEIFEQLSEKLYERFSVKTDGRSPLDDLSATGAAKLVVTAVSDMMTRLPDFKLPDGVTVPSVDDKRLKADSKYRQDLSEKYGVTIKEKDLKASPTYLHQIASDIERKMYVDFIAGHLVDATLKPHSKTDRAAEIASSTSFTQANLEGADFVHPQTSTTVRDFIAKAVGKRSEAMAAAAEKEEITAAPTTTKLAAASDNSIEKTFDKQKNKVLEILDQKHLKDGTKTPAEALGNLLESYVAARSDAEENGKTFEPLTFLKESGIIDTGIKFGFRSKARTEFNDKLKEPLIELFKAYDNKLAADKKAQALRSSDDAAPPEAKTAVAEKEEEVEEAAPAEIEEDSQEVEIEDDSTFLSDDNIDPFIGLKDTKALDDPQASERLSKFGTTLDERAKFNPGIGTDEVENGLTSVAIMAVNAVKGMASSAASAASSAMAPLQDFVSSVSERMSEAMTPASDLAARASASLEGIASRTEELTKLVTDRVGGIEAISAKAEELAKSAEEALQKNAVAISKEITTQILKLRDSTKAAKEADEQYKQERESLLEILLPKDFKHSLSSTKDVEEALDRWVEVYRVKIAEGIDKADLRQFVADNLPVTTDKETTRRVVNLAVLGSNAELALSESRESMSEVLNSVSLGLAPALKKEGEETKATVVETARLIEPTVTRAKTDDVAKSVDSNTGELAQSMTDDDEKSVYGGSEGRHPSEYLTEDSVEVPKTKTDLLKRLNEVMRKNEKLKGEKIKIDFGEQESKHPTYMILIMDKAKTNIIGIELHGGEKTRGFGDNRELFDSKGKVKEKHEETLGEFLQTFSEMNKGNNREVDSIVASLRGAGVSPGTAPCNPTATLSSVARTTSVGGSARDW